MRPSDWWKRQSPLPLRWVYPLSGVALSVVATLGLLVLRNHVTRQPFTRAWVSAELDVEGLVYMYVAVALASLLVVLGGVLGRKEDRLWASSHTDPLTGVGNRRHLEERLAEELVDVRRGGARLAVLLVDVDNLKAINDRGGHKAGDDAIRTVARVLQQSCRASDLVARLGGDEFAVVASGSGAGEALVVAERIRSSLEREAARGGGRDGARVSVSIGIGDVTRLQSPRVEGLMALADRALYMAKQSGRNRAVIGGSVGASDATPTRRMPVHGTRRRRAHGQSPVA